MRVRIVSAVCLYLFSLASYSATVAFADEDDSKGTEKFIEWKLPVGFPKSSPAKVGTLATRLAKTLKCLGTWENERNPGCCIWLDIGTWQRSGEPRYLIVIQPAGGVILASDTRQLTLAIDKLEEVLRYEGDKVLVPVGLITNYRIIDEK